VAKIALESNNLGSSLLTSDSLRVNKLILALNQYEQSLVFPDSIEQVITYTDSYIKGYYAIIPNGFNVYRTIKSTTELVGGYFGLRSIISSLLPDKAKNVSLAKKRKISNYYRQDKARLFEGLVALQAYINNELIPIIDTSEINMKRDFQKLFSSENVKATSLDHYYLYNEPFIQRFKKVIKTKKAAELLSKSIDNILKAENELMEMTSKRQKVEMNSYYILNLSSDLPKIARLLDETK